MTAEEPEQSFEDQESRLNMDAVDFSFLHKHLLIEGRSWFEASTVAKRFIFKFGLFLKTFL